MSVKLKSISQMVLLLLFCFIAGTVSAQTVNGNVVDETGEAVIGATVIEKGTQNATVTDFDGNFTIKMSKGNVLTISYIGMQSQDVNVAGKNNIKVTLKEDNTTLQDVVVVGYGTMKKSDLTGSVSSINTEQLNAKGATTVMGNLQGSVPGVNITQNSSRAGGGFEIEIRGKSSFNSSSTPLYVVDGIITDNIDFLNPQDIERIDILKDASSTAIYGSRATNGVVIVSTKSAKVQGKKHTKPTISYDGYYGIVKTARMPDFMNGSQFSQYRHFRYLNAMTEKGGQTLAGYGAQNNWGITQGNYQTAWLTRGDLSDSYIKDVIANGKETDWIGLFTRTGAQQNHFISVGGNGGNVNYYFGAGYQNEQSIFKGDNMERFNLKATIDSKITDWISAGISLNGAFTENRTVDDTAIGSAFRLNTVTRAYDDDNNIILYPGKSAYLGTSGDQFTGTANPLTDLEKSYYNTRTYQLLANLYIELTPIKDLSLKSTFSPSYTAIRNGQFEDTNTSARGENLNHAYANNYHKLQWTWDNQITYDFKYKDHNLNVMGLFSATKFTQDKYENSVYGIIPQTLWYNLGQASDKTNYTIGSDYTEWSMLSWAARVAYNYLGRYYFTGTIRWDGSSRFADGHRWGSFPSAAIAWRISEEPFMEKTKSWLSNLKLRLSYGQTGNNAVGNYATQAIAKGGSIYYGYGTPVAGVYPGSYPYYPNGIVNKALTWEKTTEFNIGLDFGFLNGRINGTIDWYNRKAKDLLAERQLPYIAGGATVTDNIAKVKNTGIEISLNTVNVQTKDWNWTTSFNFSHNHNEVVETSTGKDEIANSLFIGESYNVLRNYIWSGIVSDREMTVPDTKIARDKGFTPGESVISRDYYYACYGWGEGMPIIEDLNGDGAITDDDKSFIGKSNPTWTGSITSNLTWKNWDFSFNIYTKQDYKVYSPFYKQYTNYGDRGMQHINMDFYIPAGTLLSCDYDANGNRINEVYQEETHYGSYPFPTNQSETAAGVGTYAFSSNGKNGADNMSSMKTANKNGAPYQVVDASYWKVKNITLGYTFPKNILAKTKIINSLRLYINITNPFVWGSDYKGYDPEWAGASLANGGPSTVTYQFGASVKF